MCKWVNWRSFEEKENRTYERVSHANSLRNDDRCAFLFTVGIGLVAEMGIKFNARFFHIRAPYGLKLFARPVHR